MLIITADDFGKSRQATDNILKCFFDRRITSASAMVFMEDSERAASLCRNIEMETGLHLNFTEAFTGSPVSSHIQKHQKRIMEYVNKNKFAQIVYNPFLATSFHIVFNAQLEAFQVLYGRMPDYYNGHHHMHLCTNMLFGRLMPEGARVRRTYTFNRGEKHIINLWYRSLLNRRISKNYISTDRFFSILPFENTERLADIISRAQREDIEIEVHPENKKETAFLLSEPYRKLITGVRCGEFQQLIQQ